MTRRGGPPQTTDALSPSIASGYGPTSPNILPGPPRASQLSNGNVPSGPRQTPTRPFGNVNSRRGSDRNGGRAPAEADGPYAHDQASKDHSMDPPEDRRRMNRVYEEDPRQTPSMYPSRSAPEEHNRPTGGSTGWGQHVQQGSPPDGSRGGGHRNQYLPEFPVRPLSFSAKAVSNPFQGRGRKRGGAGRPLSGTNSIPIGAGRGATVAPLPMPPPPAPSGPASTRGGPRQNFEREVGTFLPPLAPLLTCFRRHHIDPTICIFQLQLSHLPEYAPSIWHQHFH